MAISVNRLERAGVLDDVAIYEAALGGPFVKVFASLPTYQNSYYWPGAGPGDVINGVQFQDLSALTFTDESFDVVITSDVFEHVFEPFTAFAEIKRVLKVGGAHIFTLPLAYPLPEHSMARAVIADGEVVHLQEPRYHRAGDGQDSLVVTDWGADIVDGLQQLGMQTQIQRLSTFDPAFQNATLVSRRVW